MNMNTNMNLYDDVGLYLTLCQSGSLPADNDNFPVPYKLIELPLRVFVLSAQVLAGMWRRNGFAIPNQVCNIYHCEMFERK